MPQSLEELIDRIKVQTETGFRGRIVARGLARGIIWSNGRLPDGAPDFSPTLTADLLDYGYGLLARACQLKDADGPVDLVERAFRIGGEAIESCLRKGDPEEPTRGFHLVVAAAAFHIARFSARAYSLLNLQLPSLNLSSSDLALAALIRRSTSEFRTICLGWYTEEANTDEGATRRVQAPDSDYSLDDVLALALTRTFFRALALFDFALDTGDEASAGEALQLLEKGRNASAETGFVPQWWINTLARYLIEDFWARTLYRRLPTVPPDSEASAWNSIRSDYIATQVARPMRQIELWPSQLSAATRVLEQSDDLVVALPTSAGKTKIAELCILRALAAGKRVIYVTPLRALSAQSEQSLARVFRPLGVSVTSLYGASGVAVADIDTLRTYQIVVATPEKLDFAVRQQPSIIDDVGLIVLDEGHMIGLGPREVRYEVLVQRLLSRSDANARRIVCLSAVFDTGPAFQDFNRWLRSDEPGEAIVSDWRPTRRRSGYIQWRNGNGDLYLWVNEEGPFVRRFIKPRPPVGRRTTPLPRNAAELVATTVEAFITQGHTVLVYCPTRASVQAQADVFLTLYRQRMLEPQRPVEEAIKRAIYVGEEWLGSNHVALQALRVGIAVHHAGLPRQFLSEIEDLLNRRESSPLKIIIASPTLAQGIDLSCSALVFQSIYRRGSLIRPEEYANVVGRAGRAFVDLDGISIYPIFDEGRRGARKLSEYQSLRVSAETRQMESGILLLIDEIANRLANHAGGSKQALLDYILNNNGWNDLAERAQSSAASEETDSGGASVPLNVLLSDLDAAILGTIENLECSVDELADLLDSALRSSLWLRRLQNREQLDKDLQRNIVVHRARWIWSNSTQNERKGFFSAGLGYEAGSFLGAHIEEMVPLLMQAELAFDDQQPESAIEPLCSIIQRLLNVHPFATRNPPSDWPRLVRGWVLGTPLSELISSGARNEFEFIQDGLVYRMVWGVEAIRVYANAVARLTGDELRGKSALALTYGMPYTQGALLLQAGLPSRRMALRVAYAFPIESMTPSSFPSWIRTVIAQSEGEELWREPSEAQLWREFVNIWRTTEGAAWGRSTHQVGFSLNDGVERPPSGAAVRLVNNNGSERTVVCNRDLTEIGRLLDRPLWTEQGHLLVHVSENTGVLSVSRFGPSIPRDYDLP